MAPAHPHSVAKACHSSRASLRFALLSHIAASSSEPKSKRSSHHRSPRVCTDEECYCLLRYFISCSLPVLDFSIFHGLRPFLRTRCKAPLPRRSLHDLRAGRGRSRRRSRVQAVEKQSRHLRRKTPTARRRGGGNACHALRGRVFLPPLVRGRRTPVPLSARLLEPEEARLCSPRHRSASRARCVM